MKTFIVLGMHRSATSLIAKGLSVSGVHMGNALLSANPTNPNGHYEDIDFVCLNEKILREAGGTWDNPPDESAIRDVGIDMEDIISSVIEGKSEKHELWGWKDPRTTLTIRCYVPHLNNPHFITCFREPIEVAESLHRRDGMLIEYGIALAGIYNNRLIKFLSEQIKNEVFV